MPVVAAYLSELPMRRVRADLAVGHPPAVEMGVQLRGRALGTQAALGVVGQPSQREQREVVLGDDIRAVPGPPELGE